MENKMLPIPFAELNLSPPLTTALAMFVTATLILGIVGLGRLILRQSASANLAMNQLPKDPIVSLGLQIGCGLAALAFLNWGLGSIGLLRLVPPIVLILAASALPGLSRYLSQTMAKGWTKPQTTSTRILLAILLFAAGSTILTTLYPHNHGDPLYYHLSSPWIWSRAESIYFIDWMPWHLQGGLGEYLYAGLASGLKDRMALLLSAQMLHATIGYGGSLILTIGISRRLLQEKGINQSEQEHRGIDQRLEAALVLLAGIAMACIPSELFMLTHAKNDGFVLFFGLLAINLSLSHQIFLRAMGFLACGVAVACKSSAIFFVIPFYIFNLLTELRNPQSRQIWFAALGGILVASTILLRNYYDSGSPFFPAMTGLFPSPLVDQSIAEMVSRFTRVPGNGLEIFMTQGHRFFWAMPFFLFSIWGTLTASKNRAIRKIALIHFGSLAVYIAVSSQGTTGRFLFVIYGTGAALAAVGLADLLQRLSARGFKNKHLVAFIWAVFLVTILPASSAEVPFVQLNTKVADFLTSDGTAFDWFSIHKPEIKMHRWMNRHLTRDAVLPPIKILSFFENENLFLDFPVSVPENEIRASMVKHAPNYESAIFRICSGGFTHLLIGLKYEKNYIDQITANSNFSVDFPIIHEEAGYILRRASRC